MKANKMSYTIFMIMMLSSVNGLTTNEFYKDLSVEVAASVSSPDEPNPSPFISLPFDQPITNLKGGFTAYPTRFQLRLARFDLYEGSNPLYTFSFLIPNSLAFREGSTQVQFSTNPSLLARAHQDIINGFNVDPNTVAPTNLILYESIGAVAGDGNMVTTFQAVIATNFEFTYLIILFVSVEPNADTRNDRAQLTFTNAVINLPYADDILNAPFNSFKSDVPGQYVIDLNESPPPPAPPCPSCNDRIMSVACQVMRLQSNGNENEIPRPCRNDNA